MRRFKFPVHLFVALVAVFLMSACTSPKDTQQPAAKTKTPADSNAPKISNSMPNKEVEAEQIAERFPQSTPVGDSGLRIIVTHPGEGATAGKNSTVSVNYRGMLWNGDVFDSSYDRGRPIQFGLGRGRVIRGWDEGIPGMRVGEKRTLIIPYTLAYGANGRPPSIPARAPLIFSVELMGVN